MFTFASDVKRVFVRNCWYDNIYIYITCALIRMKIKSFSCGSKVSYVPSGPSGQRLFQFLQHEATRSISTTRCMGSWSIAGLPPAFNLPVMIYTPEWILRHCQSKVSHPRTQYSQPKLEPRLLEIEKKSKVTQTAHNF